MDETVPVPGEFVEVRGRPWLVETACALDEDLQHLGLSCISDDAQGETISVVWSAEVGARHASREIWTRIGDHGVDDAELYSAYLRTLRWNSVTATDRRLFQAPFRAGIKLDAYQLAPLRKALELPRVNLLIADDVGLGKTIEAGLIVREMLLRRQIEFTVVAAPPSMTLQWKEELEAKFGLAFEIIELDFLRQVRNRRGYGANPWNIGSRFIISHRLLLNETYAAGLRDRLGEFDAKSLLILDEAHHAAPARGTGYAVDSQLTAAVRDLAPRFEHRLFLTATPHNGHSNSFSALLEMLDPQRFTRGLTPTARQRDAVMVRRLKEDLRKLGVRFPRREVIPVRLDGLPDDTPELKLSHMLGTYGDLRNRRISKLPKSKQPSAQLVFSGLQQRLLSSVYAFGRTLRVHLDSLERLIEHQAIPQTAAAALSFAEAIDDTPSLDIEEEDAEAILEADGKDAAVSATVLGSEGAVAAELRAEAAMVLEMLAIAEAAAAKPDARVRWLMSWIEENMVPSAGWNGHRLIIFTEYEHTRQWLQRRLGEEIAVIGHVEGRIANLSGPTGRDRREAIKLAFNTPPDKAPLRILICTDAAREGINLQMYCHDLVHFDLPWNPSRLEQRNGRIDRKLQPSPAVHCHYFIYPQRKIDIVLRALVRKTETIQSELGSLGKVIEDRICALLSGTGIQPGAEEDLARDIDNEDGGEAIAQARRELEEQEQQDRLDRVRDELDSLRRMLDQSRKRVGVEPEELRQVMDVALKQTGAPLADFTSRKVGQTEAIGLDPDHHAFARDASWARTFDDLRIRPRGRRERLASWRAEAPIRQIAFEPPELEDGRFAEDVVQIHLEHRLVRRLLSRFVSQGFQSGLNRVCVFRSSYAEPRVVLLGRISLYGQGAARLHEEIIPVTARWRERERDTKPFEPLKEAGEQTTLEQLADALIAARPVDDHVTQRVRRYVEADIQALRPELERRAEVSRLENVARLKKIGDAEANALRKILEDQKKRIAKEAAAFEPDQLALPGIGREERRQKEKDYAFWQRRIESIATEIDSEPARILAAYKLRADRLEPVGLIYLWPATG